jgi:hypothetical protein
MTVAVIILQALADAKKNILYNQVAVLSVRYELRLRKS